MTVEALAMGQTLENAKEAIQSAISELMDRMESIEQGEPLVENASWHLQLAKGHMAQRQWEKAAIHFDKYCALDPLSSEIQFARGVAHANTRGGRVADTNALRAYNEAIAHFEEGRSTNLRARYFAYRGAMLKRLKRLDEAHADLRIALKYADQAFEINDIRYNLAGVHAMMGNREEMMENVKLLQGCRRELMGIRSHLDDYFKDFATDEQLLKYLSPE